ncbi:MAG TPA: hypothetical protein PK076_02275, partial [Saprospiraceae bacterium]|nr:hypothetical protein [Saprospiraceae bacterium]HQW54918.1 hypothetical protein [Saprospiraceae bacterium]
SHRKVGVFLCPEVWPASDYITVKLNNLYIFISHIRLFDLYLSADRTTKSLSKKYSLPGTVF